MKPSKRKPLRHVDESEMEVIEHVVELKPHSQFIDEIKETADKLQRDGATRGDLKILSRTLWQVLSGHGLYTGG